MGDVAKQTKEPKKQLQMTQLKSLAVKTHKATEDMQKNKVIPSTVISPRKSPWPGPLGPPSCLCHKNPSLSQAFQ